MNLTNPTVLRQLLEPQGFRFSKSMGQNFLIAPWVPERIAEEAELDDTVGVLEVGPGVGCLTQELSARAGKVVSVELDERLRPVLRQTLADCPNAEVVFGDVLKQNLPELVRDKLAGLTPVVCANLPYNVTSPLLTAFFEAGCFRRLTVMVQKEVAQRLCAAPGTADYGAFTVYTQWHAEPTVVRLDVRETPPVAVRDEKRMFRIVRAAFNQRRKTLLNALSSGLSGFTKEQIAAAVEACGLDARVRGEALGIAQFAALSDALGE